MMEPKQGKATSKDCTNMKSFKEGGRLWQISIKGSGGEAYWYFAYFSGPNGCLREVRGHTIKGIWIDSNKSIIARDVT
jgi:hypothetical protein